MITDFSIPGELAPPSLAAYAAARIRFAGPRALDVSVA